MKNHIQSIRRILSNIIALYLFLCLFASSGFSQNATISTELLILPDTSYLGGSATATIHVRNIGTTAYSGYLNIYYTTDTVAFSPLLLCSLQNVTLLPLDTISTNCTMNFDSSNYFVTGSNIVVVWSSGNGKLAADSLRDTVYLNQTAGIHENNLNASFTIFPSPAKDFVTIKFNKHTLPKDFLQSIKITDVFGRTMHTELFTGGEGQKISVRNLPSGLYFLELQYGNRKKAIQKFVRMD